MAVRNQVASSSEGGQLSYGVGPDGVANAQAVDANGIASVATTSQAGTLVPSTITAGGTAQNIFSATPVNGFEVINPHATETLYIRENGTATAADNGNSIPIASKGSYTTPQGYKPTGDVSVIAATTGHAFIARRW